ncbi:MAG TPA: hypothetical protein VHV51_02005 [Polyangiaceae bacterium]|jgi:hypothetical protein|nr:hypothetical protein [Polyangiaceae bacterium]
MMTLRLDRAVARGVASGVAVSAALLDRVSESRQPQMKAKPNFGVRRSELEFAQPQLNQKHGLITLKGDYAAPFTGASRSVWPRGSRWRFRVKAVVRIAFAAQAACAVLNSNAPRFGTLPFLAPDRSHGFSHVSSHFFEVRAGSVLLLRRCFLGVRGRAGRPSERRGRR